MHDQLQRRGRIFRMWQIPAAIVALLVIAAVAWLLPRRAQEVVLVDGAHRWERSSAPPQRNIVWRPAEPVAAGVRQATPGDSLVRPLLAEGGVALYFTLQRSAGGADIYRAQYDGERWLPAEPVAALNSPSDDFGPALSADGKTLYLYSDRPGGYGGFDLYVARRTEKGWSAPRNVGPHINTPAHEYDPAVTPDGKRLFFSSNRTHQMEAQLAASRTSGGAPWKATLRAEPGLPQFDLYVVERDAAAQNWKSAVKLAAVSSPASNEGEPFVAPDGAFLYFASDRPNDRGREGNYDIYRARLTGTDIGRVENLGTGVNSPSNEHDPALSPEGFRLVFSSDRSPAKDSAAAPQSPPLEQYVLYTSQATETFDDTYWDASHLAVLAGLWWWIVLALLLLGLLLALVWYARQVSLRRAPVPVFFLVALLLHLLALTGAFFIPIEGVTLAERVRQKIEQIVVASLPLDSSHQSHADGPAAYEKVADLQSLETTKISAVPRQIVEPPRMPLPTSRPAPSLPQRLETEQMREHAISAHNVVQQEVVDPLMERRQRVIDQMMAESVVKIDTAPKQIESQTRADAATEKVSASRSDAPRRLDVEPPVPPRRIDLAQLIEAEEMQVDQIKEASAPAKRPSENPLQRSQPADVAQLESPQVPLENLAASPAGSPSEGEQVAKLEVTVDRNTNSESLSDLPRRAPSAAATAAKLLDAADVGALEVPAAMKPASSAVNEQRNALARQDQLARIDAVESGAIDTQLADESEAAAPAIDGAEPPSMRVAVSRTAERLDNVGAMRPTQIGVSNAGMRLETAIESAESPSAIAPQSSTTDAVAAIARRGSRATEALAAASQAEAIELPQSTGANGTGDESEMTGEAVQLARGDAAASLSEIVSLSGISERMKTGRSSISPAGEEARESSSNAIQQRLLSNIDAQLTRSARRELSAAAAAEGRIDTELNMATSSDNASMTTAEGVDVNVERATTGRELSVSVAAPDLLGGRYDKAREELAIGELAQVEVQAELSFSPIASALDRQRARAPFLFYAQDKIGLQAMLRLRVGDDGQKQDLIDAFGGRKDTLEAIQRGLHWLALVQHADGHWDLKNFPQGPGGENFSGHGSEKSDTAATGLGLLPFLGDGHTHEVGKYQATVSKGIDWLVKNQKEDGDLFAGGEWNSHLYSHGIATIALCEAYGITKDEKLQRPAQLAVDFIVSAQHDEGGWRYRPKERGDTSVVGWQIMALKSAQMAGLNVPAATLDKARDWLNKSRYGQEGREFAYQPGGGGTAALTAEGLLCMEYLGGKRGEPQLMRTVDLVVERLPKVGQDNSYYWYYGTQAIFHVQGEPWKIWNAAMSEAVLSAQIAEGPHRGTWDPRDEWEQRGGRIYATSLRLLMLEVYFRHLPLYQALE